MPDLGYILFLLAILLGIGGAVLIAVSFVSGDRRRNDLFMGNLTAAETIVLGRNLILWGVILSLLALILRLILSPPTRQAGVAPNNAALVAPASPKTTAVPINPANAPPKAPAQGNYQAICVPPKNGGLNLRSDPGSAASVVLVIPCNTTGLRPTGVPVDQDGDQWVPINYNGTPGWVYGGLIQPSR